MTQKIGAGRLSCADKIWETADTLRGAGIKASDWPGYMMPFFALMLLESRLRRLRLERVQEFVREAKAEFSIEAPARGFHREFRLYGKHAAERCATFHGH